MKDTSFIQRSSKPGKTAVAPALVLGQDFVSLRQRQPKLFHLALREAEALAWQTPFPHLVFPELAAEKLRAAARWQQRQDAIAPGSESAFAA